MSFARAALRSIFVLGLMGLASNLFLVYIFCVCYSFHLDTKGALLVQKTAVKLCKEVRNQELGEGSANCYKYVLNMSLKSMYKMVEGQKPLVTLLND